MHAKRIPQYCKMMKLSRREILKELFPTKLMSKLVIKLRIQEGEKEKLIV